MNGGVCTCGCHRRGSYDPSLSLALCHALCICACHCMPGESFCHCRHDNTVGYCVDQYGVCVLEAAVHVAYGVLVELKRFGVYIRHEVSPGR